eukprot:gene10214-13742_t
MMFTSIKNNNYCKRFCTFNSKVHHKKKLLSNQGRRYSQSKTDFGFQEVAANEKERLVREVFSKVAGKYDVMNDFMSAGAHRLWKDDLVEMIGYSAASKIQPDYFPRHIDVAGGTGDVAFRSLKLLTKYYPNITSNLMLAPSERQVVVCDINPDMLAVGQDRAPKQVGEKNSQMIGFVEGNAELLPFPDNSFDIYTIAFGLRNVTNKETAIREAYRVLKKGGRMMIMEFSHIENPILRTMYDQYSFNIIPKLGEIVANDKASYQYLVESIRRFPNQRTLAKMMENESFVSVNYTNLTFGVVAIHSGFKL